MGGCGVLVWLGVVDDGAVESGGLMDRLEGKATDYPVWLIRGLLAGNPEAIADGILWIPFLATVFVGIWEHFRG